MDNGQMLEVTVLEERLYPQPEEEKVQSSYLNNEPEKKEEGSGELYQMINDSGSSYEEESENENTETETVIEAAEDLISFEPEIGFEEDNKENCSEEKPEERSEERSEDKTEAAPAASGDSIMKEIENISKRLDVLSDNLNQGSLEKELNDLNTKLSDLSSRVSSLRKLADMHEDIETKLNNRINEYENNFYRRIMNPVLIELFDVQEDMMAEAESAGVTDDVRKILFEYIESLTKVLKHYGVRVETVSKGNTYDPKIHKPLKAINTDNKELDGKIEKVKKHLVHFIDDKIHERAGVFVYQYSENQQ